MVDETSGRDAVRKVNGVVPLNLLDLSADRGRFGGVSWYGSQRCRRAMPMCRRRELAQVPQGRSKRAAIRQAAADLFGAVGIDAHRHLQMAEVQALLARQGHADTPPRSMTFTNRPA